MTDGTTKPIPRSDNNRVTTALLGEKMDNLTEIVKEMREEFQASRRDQELRLRTLERWQAESQTRWQLAGGAGLGGMITGAVALLRDLLN